MAVDANAHPPSSDSRNPPMNRRHILASALATPFLLRHAGARAEFAPGTSKAGVEALQTNWKEYLAPKADVATDATPLKLTDDE